MPVWGGRIDDLSSSIKYTNDLPRSALKESFRGQFGDPLIYVGYDTESSDPLYRVLSRLLSTPKDEFVLGGLYAQ